MDAEVQVETERWFVRRGLPHAIDDYSATEDVLTRAAPFLAAVFLIEVFASFDDRFEGWAQVGVFLAGAAILLGSVVVLNRLRGRAPLQLPDEIGVLELAVFVFVPALLPVLFSDERGWRFLAIVVINLLLLGATYVVTSYGLLPMIRFGAEQVGKRIGHLGQLIARTLPLLLLFTAFVFLNAEMWQVASDFNPVFYGIVVGFLVLSGMGFMAMRAPREVADLEQFDHWDDVVRLAGQTSAPLAGTRPRHPEVAPHVAPLERGDRTNVTLLVVISQLVQVALVAVVIGLFYVGFGLLAVRGATIEQWTTAPLDPLATVELFGSTVIVTWEHLAVAGFIAAFSALQFAVSMVTDTAYRDEFYDDVTGEIRGILAVRALYLEALNEPRSVSEA